MNGRMVRCSLMESRFELSLVRLQSCVWLHLICAGCFVLPSSPLAAQSPSEEDVVVVRVAGRTPTETANRKGRILEWKAGSLTLLTSGGQREIDNEQIVEIRTAWPQEYQEAMRLLDQGKSGQAIDKLKSALASESREWADRVIASHLVEELMLLDQPDAASKHFLQLLQSDPNSRFLHLAPIPWAGSSRRFTDSQRWMKDSAAILSLVGASWSTSGAQRADEAQKVDGLVDDLDPRIRALAMAQKWRLSPRTSAQQLNAWQKLVEEMPRSARAGPLFVLAEKQAAGNLPDQAMINWMKIVTIYPQQRSLVAASLYRIGKTLQKQGQTDAASTMFRELRERFPESIWAQSTNQN